VVATGVIQSGRVEITQGLKVGETVVVDGAGFLSDGAALKIKGAGSKP
jgi:multidrug efflux pump subunit AcrA (membrane-fusion protein)